MTTEEAIDALMAADPKRGYSATKAVRVTQFLGPRRSTEYSVSVHPGVHGQECSIFTGHTMEHATNQAIAALVPPTSTENHE